MRSNSIDCFSLSFQVSSGQDVYEWLNLKGVNECLTDCSDIVLHRNSTSNCLRMFALNYCLENIRFGLVQNASLHSIALVNNRHCHVWHILSLACHRIDQFNLGSRRTHRELFPWCRCQRRRGRRRRLRARWSWWRRVGWSPPRCSSPECSSWTWTGTLRGWSPSRWPSCWSQSSCWSW